MYAQNTLRTLRVLNTRNAQQIVTKRFMEFENKPGTNMPFKVGNKFVFGAKFTTFVVVGFSLPFVGVWWQNVYKA